MKKFCLPRYRKRNWFNRSIFLCAMFVCARFTFASSSPHKHTVYCEKFSLPMWKRRCARKMLFLNGLMHIHTYNSKHIFRCRHTKVHNIILTTTHVSWGGKVRCMRCTTPASCSIIVKKNILNENSLTSFWRNQFANKCLCGKKNRNNDG